MYQKIIAYKMLHKNTIVPFHYQEDPKLGHWVSQQREKYRKLELLPKRVDLLESIGFEWDGNDELGMGMYQKTVAYKDMHKNCMVPSQYQEDPKLGHWVSQQREKYRKLELLSKRVDLLELIGFEWDGAKESFDELWMGMFQKHVAYKDMHKNSMVPIRYQEDPKLGYWVSQQRKKYKNEELLPQRVDLLKSIDFE